MLYNKHLIRFTAKVMLGTLSCQLIFPAVSSALTTGPSQPEVQSFEPVGTTDMVDMFTGDFVYNIPLLDIEGYPVNISYHSGADMEQEASWVGLGWNINPGVVNRTVRGMPDDFNGEQIGKTVHIKPEKNVRVGVGVGAELFGAGTPQIGLSADINLALNVSNYRGVSADVSLSAGVNVAGMASAGINLGVGSQSGADVDYNLGLSFNSSQIIGSDVGVNLGVGMNSGYNTRSGVKDRNFNLNAGVTYKGAGISKGWSATVPIGVRNIIPVITNRTTMKMYRGQIKLGGELYGTYWHAAIFGMVSTLKYDDDGSMKGFGYLYSENADDQSILDFTRDRDGMFNETMSFLPPGNMTYDIYAVSGQGTGGSFRPFRNDFGSVYDPAVSSQGSEFGANLEVGLGNLFEVGGDITVSNTDITSGPWDAYKRPFTSREPGSIYENTYFKQAGEATEVNPGLFAAISGIVPIKGNQTANIPLKKPGSELKRDPRGNLVSYFTAAEAATEGVAGSRKLYSYDQDGFTSGANASRTEIDRLDNGRKAHHISEVVQTQTDGRRYVYGLPAMNTSQSEVTFACGSNPGGDGLIDYTAQQASVSNGSGRDNFYTNTSTPAYAHSYLLTSVLSADYVDVKGDGVTDDDFGTFTKFNYSRKNTAFGWKAPYGNMKAQYNAGFKSDPMDDKASFLEGTREQWMLHSIESRNFVAEFYTSEREDARGKNPATDKSFKLDSIRLYNKHDRFINTTAAVPIKTVIFNYTNNLCLGVPNNVNGKGKLTLEKIYVRYGNSDRSMISPYQFKYGNNYAYNAAGKDRWGVYKPNNDPNLRNWDFPFTKQDDPDLDKYASAWSLQEITLPSGGTIKIRYESDDYAYVQDKVAMEMFRLSGVGNSTNYSGGNQLYFDKNNPNLYFYFNRRTASEKPGLSLRDNYLKGTNLLYYNFDTRIVDNAYEPIKGYAEVEEVGQCSDGVHGYIKVKPVAISGGGASLNHVTYTAINFARYYLPHIVFPGSDPDASDISNVLAGLQYAFSELLSFTKNPVKRMVEESKAKEVKLASSFMRLHNPGLKKKGGGSRVKELKFEDNWASLAGGNSNNATYGKTYDYTTEDQGSYGTISSGVASYEPQIGGDENPFREPVNYIVQSGSKWPPNDPVGVYQELPVGESLYPGAVVGYSRVTVRSIHQEEGRSSQGEDIYDFYTAKDFPVQAQATGLQVLNNTNDYNFTEQTKIYEGTQGYTLVFNDMHGKPKRTEHRILKPSGASELVSYQQYNYFTQGGQLYNTVPVVEYDPVAGKLKKTEKQVGYEADLTIDTREKKEATESNTLYLNLNAFLLGFIPIPIPYWYDHDFNFRNEFRSAVATKVVQQYGILKEVVSSQEGALTTVRNEAFDPVTGQALITSVNNEFNDKEYSVNYPAYWGYKSMGPSYRNTGYTENFASISIQDYAARIPNVSSLNYRIGDELLIEYTEGGSPKQRNAWVMGMYIQDSTMRARIKCGSPNCVNINGATIVDTMDLNASDYLFTYGCGEPNGEVRAFGNCGNITLVVKPRYKHSWPQNGTMENVRIKVVRSGAKNQLNESIQSYTSMARPFDNNNYLKDNLEKVISMSAREFSDTLTAILPKHDSIVTPNGWDSLNIYVNGTRQIKRLSKEYAYLKNRDYSNSATRNAGLFDAVSLWKIGSVADNCNAQTKYCIVDTQGGSWQGNPNPSSVLRVLRYQAYTPPAYINDYNFLVPQPSSDKNWVLARTVTKYSPWGYELENKDAIGNYTAAMYGYNQQLPVALAQNARQQEMFAESFEDYQLLQVMSALTTMNFNPYASLLNSFITVGGVYNRYNIPSTLMTSQYAHTGKYAFITSGAGSIVLKVSANPVPAGQPRYLPFTMQQGKQYLISYWFRPQNPSGLQNNYSAPSGMQLKSNIIDGWQQVEGVITASGASYTLALPGGSYVDDIRILPVDANMKSFVYHPVNQRLIATLDENNFASFYEYDQEGNLVRTKKETEKGIITVMESRSANVKKSN